MYHAIFRHLTEQAAGAPAAARDEAELEAEVDEHRRPMAARVHRDQFLRADEDLVRERRRAAQPEALLSDLGHDGPVGIVEDVDREDCARRIRLARTPLAEPPPKKCAPLGQDGVAGVVAVGGPLPLLRRQPLAHHPDAPAEPTGVDHKDVWLMFIFIRRIH